MDIERPDLKRRKLLKRWLIACLGLLLLGSAGLALRSSDLGQPVLERERLWIEAVRRGEMLRAVRAQGVLAPREIRWISAVTTANVDRILVRPGTHVDGDTVLMQLSNPELLSDLDTARASLAAARADNAAHAMTQQSQMLDLQATEAQLIAARDLAEAKLRAGEQLTKSGNIAELEYREYQLNAHQQQTLLGLQRQRIAKFHETQQAQALADRARLTQLEDVLALKQKRVSALEVRAGTSGVLQSVAVQEGAQVTAGANLARVATPGALRAELNVSETDAREIQVGQRVTVDLRVASVTGTVERVDPAVVHNTVQVDVALPASLPEVARADLSVDGTIDIGRLANVLYVSRPSATREGGSTRLFRLDADGRHARRLPVTFGRMSATSAEILRGLDAGDRVILSDMSAYDANEIIRIR